MLFLYIDKMMPCNKYNCQSLLKGGSLKFVGFIIICVCL